MRRRPWVAMVPMLGGTYLGTVGTNIVTVPLRDIARDLGVPLSQAVLALIAFLLTFAVSLPFAGWLGDRAGRRRVYAAALTVFAVGSLGAALAPNLTVLVGFRALQGLATGAIVPTVMGMISMLFGARQRGRAMGAWAAVNGLGQASAPVVGGLVAQLASWRWMFVPMVPLAVLLVALTMWLVPPEPGARLPFDWIGAATLTVGTALLISGATAVPQPGLDRVVAAVLALAGVVALAAFAMHTRRAAHPFVSPALLREPSYLRSSIAVFAQMFCLGATLLGVPVYLTGDAGMSVAVAGLVALALPVTMAALAPISGVLTDRIGPRRVIRAGLVVLASSQLAFAIEFSSGGRSYAVVLGLVVSGIGVALVQTPAALGATRSGTGRAGASLGLFNLIRFSGSAVGAAWVAIALSSKRPFEFMFGLCAVIAVVGYAGTFAGPTPAPGPEPG